MQWLIDSVIATWRTLYPRVDKIELIAPDVDELIRGDGSKWVGTPIQTILNNYPRYFDAGHKAAADFLTGAFTMDGAWHTLSLAALIPVGTIMVNLRLVIRPSLSAHYLVFSTTAASGGWNASMTRPPLAGVLFNQNVMVRPTASRAVDYQFQSHFFNYCALTVGGWWK